ncbi:uncharacterized protein LOC125561195 [Nematostella vectensis]|uniref:uncharacterized protein LOC125561195 n=1 Tax=Nematostella vectensis TaxID=45351 RepID=UPI0020771432|nr:uncharacterized protein LOC125561195 [Nematostella vectensis]
MPGFWRCATVGVIALGGAALAYYGYQHWHMNEEKVPSTIKKAGKAVSMEIEANGQEKEAEVSQIRTDVCLATTTQEKVDLVTTSSNVYHPTKDVADIEHANDASEEVSIDATAVAGELEKPKDVVACKSEARVFVDKADNSLDVAVQGHCDGKVWEDVIIPGNGGDGEWSEELDMGLQDGFDWLVGADNEFARKIERETKKLRKLCLETAKHSPSYNDVSWARSSLSIE